MVYGLMARLLRLDAPEGMPLVRVDRLRVLRHYVVNEPVNLRLLALRARLDTDANPAVALNGSEQQRLVVAPVSALAPTADPRLVSLDDPVEQFVPLAISHRCADAMAEVPGRLVALDVQHALNLECRDALLGLDDQVDRREPLPKVELGVLENRSRENGESLAA